MSSSEMMEKFRQFATADLFSKNPTRTRQVSRVIHETDSIRIVLTRHEGERPLDVDVEVSLPSLTETSNTDIVRDSIDKIMDTLEYLKRLIGIGFDLELMRDEGILVASRLLNLDTPLEVFEILQPP